MNSEKYIGETQSQISPPQGMTSSVVILHAERGKFVVKRSDRAPYVAWLKREAIVLQALAAIDLPIPRFVALKEEPASASLLMTALPGEPLSALLQRGVSTNVRQDLLTQFGALLSKIHSTPVPSPLQNDQPWLQRILEEGRINLEHGYAESGAIPVEKMIVTCPPATPEVLIHGDYTIDNVLVSDGKITGVIDWGRGDSGDRRYDLALATRPQEPESAFLDESDFAAFYAGYGGERLSEAELQWFSDLYDYF